MEGGGEREGRVEEREGRGRKALDYSHVSFSDQC